MLRANEGIVHTLPGTPINADDTSWFELRTEMADSGASQQLRFLVDQFSLHSLGHGQNGALFFIVFVDGHDDGLVGGQARGQDQTLVVAMNHNDGPNKAGAETPGGGPAVL